MFQYGQNVTFLINEISNIMARLHVMANKSENIKVNDSSDKEKGFYPVIIKKEEGFCIYLPEWRISGEGTSLEDAYKQFEANKKAVELRSEKYGLATLATDPYPKISKRSFYHELTLSFAKSAIGAFALVLVIILLLPNIGAAFNHQIKNIIPLELRNAKYWAIQFPAKINAQLDRVSPEEEVRIRREWGKLFERTTPILRHELSIPYRDKSADQ